MAERPRGARRSPAFVLTERADADVSLFAGCVMKEAFGETERATVRVLERDGRRVTSPARQVCCGALHAHAGDGEQARELARLNIDAFAGDDLPVVVNAAGCGAHLKAYGDVLHETRAWAQRGRVRRARPRRHRGRAAARGSGRPAAARRVSGCVSSRARPAHTRAAARPAGAIDGVTLVEIADAERCCGSAGIYNLTQPDISRSCSSKGRRDPGGAAGRGPEREPGCILEVVAGLRAAGSDVGGARHAFPRRSGRILLAHRAQNGPNGGPYGWSAHSRFRAKIEVPMSVSRSTYRHRLSSEDVRKARILITKDALEALPQSRRNAARRYGARRARRDWGRASRRPW